MVRICHPLRDGISSLINLLDSVVLRVAIWLVAFTTCAGNAFVIVCRLLLHVEYNSHSLFIKNLAGIPPRAFEKLVKLIHTATPDTTVSSCPVCRSVSGDAVRPPDALRRRKHLSGGQFTPSHQTRQNCRACLSTAAATR